MRKKSYTLRLRQDQIDWLRKQKNASQIIREALDTKILKCLTEQSHYPKEYVRLVKERDWMAENR